MPRHHSLLRRQIKAKEEFQALRKHPNRKAWGSSSPTVVNAFYAPSKNQISMCIFSSFFCINISLIFIYYV